MVAVDLTVSCGLGFGGLVRLLFCALFVGCDCLVGSYAFCIAILWGLGGFSWGFIGLGGRVGRVGLF